MIGFIRRSLTSFVFKIFFGVLVFVFIFSFVLYSYYGGGKGKSVYEVGGERISFLEIEKVKGDLFAKIWNEFGFKIKEERSFFSVDKMAILTLINRTLLLGIAKEIGIEVGEREIYDKITSRVVFKKDDKFDVDLYRQILKGKGLTWGEFEKSECRYIFIDKFLKLLFDELYITSKEIKERLGKRKNVIKIVYNFFEEKDFLSEWMLKGSFESPICLFGIQKNKNIVIFDLDFVKFSFDQYWDKVQLNKKDVESFYEFNVDKYMIFEQVRLKYFFIQAVQKVQLKKKIKKLLKILKSRDCNYLRTINFFLQRNSFGVDVFSGWKEREKVIDILRKSDSNFYPGELTVVQTPMGSYLLKTEGVFFRRKFVLAEIFFELKRKFKENDITKLLFVDVYNIFDRVKNGENFEKLVFNFAQSLSTVRISKKDIDINYTMFGIENFLYFLKKVKVGQILPIKKKNEDIFLIKMRKRFLKKIGENFKLESFYLKENYVFEQTKVMNKYSENFLQKLCFIEQKFFFYVEFCVKKSRWLETEDKILKDRFIKKFLLDCGNRLEESLLVDENFVIIFLSEKDLENLSLNSFSQREWLRKVFLEKRRRIIQDFLLILYNKVIYK